MKFWFLLFPLSFIREEGEGGGPGGFGRGRGFPGAASGVPVPMRGFLEANKMNSQGGASTLYFVGSNFREKCMEFILMVGGSAFYHLVLRPQEYFRSRKIKTESSTGTSRQPAQKSSEG